MTDLTPPLRPGRPDDAPALCELINFAGEGLPHYLWQKMAAPGETAWQVGERRARRDAGGFSWRNAVVADTGDGAAAALIGYALPESPEPFDRETTPAMFVPLLELESLAPATWYVNVLAAYPRWRGQGIGTRLLEVADRQAADAGARGLSIIVSDANHGARRLYERAGYMERARRPMVKESWENDGENWVLLVKAA